MNSKRECVEMYQVGDIVVYGFMGVCRIEAIKADAAAIEVDKLHYFLKPLHHDCLISTPVDNTSTYIRPIVSKDEADRIIDMIPSIETIEYHNVSPQQLTQQYASKLETHDCADLVELTMTIYAKKQDAERNNRKLTAVDEKFMKRAEELLFGELAAALGIPQDEVQQYIIARMGQ